MFENQAVPRQGNKASPVKQAGASGSKADSSPVEGPSSFGFSLQTKPQQLIINDNDLPLNKLHAFKPPDPSSRKQSSSAKELEVDLPNKKAVEASTPTKA